MSPLENNMVVGQDTFDLEVKCEHEGEWAIDKTDFVLGYINVVIRCVNCDATFSGMVSE